MQTRKNILLFLPGFLGGPEDWQPIRSELEENCICYSLSLSEKIEEEISSFPLERTVVIGYSMGGRIALRFQDRVADLVILSAHTGLSSAKEKALKEREDLFWIDKLNGLPYEQFLEEWYAQPLFASLRAKAELFQPLFERRKRGNPALQISLLKKFSLARQECVVPRRGLFLSGKEDLKYMTLYRTLPDSCEHLIIEGAGHALHLEQPGACIDAIRRYLGRSQDFHRY